MNKEDIKVGLFYKSKKLERARVVTKIGTARQLNIHTTKKKSTIYVEWEWVPLYNNEHKECCRLKTFSMWASEMLTEHDALHLKELDKCSICGKIVHGHLRSRHEYGGNVFFFCLGNCYKTWHNKHQFINTTFIRRQIVSFKAFFIPIDQTELEESKDIKIYITSRVILDGVVASRDISGLEMYYDPESDKFTLIPNEDFPPTFKLSEIKNLEDVKNAIRESI